MESLYAITTGVLTACGLYLTLRGRTFPVVVGLTLLSYAVNLFLFSMGGLTTDGAAIVDGAGDYADPLPQALVLTAIVIGFAMTAFVVILAMRARSEVGNDHVDGRSHDDEERSR
ncbi:Na+/H+ antiporter subunit C [Halomonas sp. MCCC 1A17488]|uniref:Na+/H+ antiporter subunit C n=1 Tax=Billgrantia sulfidoxydans TaxID=2733484 RepID=A0ABX7W1I6_9GAMM|nr:MULTISPECIES: Na+/H+ antiporter subunit C [Halomonas]MCE8016333.1 Na+/H+ antiporter subunit C [Halomonas sp. MCCC 1A17488]MCG3239666.1 Na+/H+ antiporter subunit C [Halomonas sp. MCCC 1A17488]QPP50423.1 Na+/H+ antiporter subunit C [Halomonas sp. SS10-MC5]QTP54040.1 Na+/H+ antiporter subunit C [Halomonas sulfidoxydans]